jgi:hypothetical protein
MTAISVTAAQVAPVDPEKATIRNYIAKVALTKGVPVFIDGTTGKIDIADGNGSGTKQFRGITLDAGGAGAGIRVIEEGDVYGFDLSGLNYDALVYVSDTAGSLDTAAGTVTVNVGRVAPMSDASLTKVLRVATRISGADWA